MKVTVIGAGKMGLPLACQLAHRGASVVACDIRESLVRNINDAFCPIDEPGVADLLRSALAEGKLRADTNAAAAIAESEVVVVIVPALLTEDRDADLSALISVARQIASAMRPGTLVSFETTVPVGATRGQLLPVLEESGLRAGRDFDLVYSPERVKSLYVLKHLRKTAKVVGGFDAQATRRGCEFYSTYLGADVIDVGSLETAELVKLAGMVYRDVNIALANELARYSEAFSVDFERVVAAANTDGEAAILRPGIGVGGHCTPVYPHFLIRDAERRRLPARLAEEARQINDGQAAHMVDRLEREWGPVRGRRVLILGLAFRPSVKEHLFSPAFLLRETLLARGAEVLLHDPLYSPEEIRAHGFASGSVTDGADAVILNTAHPEYAQFDFDHFAVCGGKAVVDGRNIWDPEKIRAAGLVAISVGKSGVTTAAKTESAIPIARPSIGVAEAEAAGRAIRSGWVTQGPQVAAFEREFAEAVGAAHACAVSSGTTALHLALRALDVGEGDEVITVSHSFIATANAVRYCGAVPVFVDIRPETFNLNPELIERALSPRTRAILCVHQIGMPCEMEAISRIARAHGLRLVEDAACAIGSEILVDGTWQRIGAPHGDAACFSFHPRKLLTTGDGGMITTRDASLDAKVRQWRQHGMTVSDTARHTAREVVFESYEELGWNYRMTDIQAAVGREQLKRLRGLLARRRELARRYAHLLAGVPGVRPPLEPDWARSNWQSYCVRLDEALDQRTVMQSMLDRGIATRRGVMCSHREPAYHIEPWSCGSGEGRCGCPGRCSRLRESERAQDHCILLPLFDVMTEEEQDRVVAELKKACRLRAAEAAR